MQFLLFFIFLSLFTLHFVILPCTKLVTKHTAQNWLSFKKMKIRKLTMTVDTGIAKMFGSVTDCRKVLKSTKRMVNNGGN